MLPVLAEDRNMHPREIITLDKKIQLDVGAVEVEWSPDGRYFAFVGMPTGGVNVVEVATGEVRHVEIPESEQFRGIRSLAWSRDGSQLAAVNARVLMIGSTNTLQILRRLDAEPNYYMAGPIAFANDGNSIFVECVPNKGTLIAHVDLTTLKTTPVVQELRIGDVTAHTITGRFQRFGDNLGFGTIVGFPIGKKELRSHDLKHEPTGVILSDVRYRCYFFSLVPEVSERLFIDLPDTTEVGVDGSGVHRYPDDCVLSPIHGLAVVFSGGYEKLPWIQIDESKDKTFEVYDIRSKQRTAEFGGFGSPETSWITSYDIHPTRPWVFTIARKAKGSFGPTVGLVTVWDLQTGSALQRVEVPEGPLEVRLSPDAQQLLVNISGGHLFVFKVN
jgi:WD40 repeat protein